MWNPFKRGIKELATIPVDYKPTIYTEGDATKRLTEQFKGEVQQNKIKFPTELGEEHPFDFEQMERLYKKFGFFTAVIDKYVDFVVGPGFYIECEDERAKTIIEDFMKDVNFDTILRAWTKEMLIKGSGFLEIGGDEKEGVKGLKVLSANNMYVDRDNKGKIEGYNQFVGGFTGFNMTTLLREKKVISFKPKQIAFAPFNVVGDCAYGLGIGYPAMALVDSWLSMNANEHMIMHRKANAPLHAQFGYMSDNKQVIPKSADVQALGKDIEIMHNKTDWVTDPLVNFKVVDFPNFGEKFALTKESDLNMLIYAFQVPAVLLGMANINQGIAKVELEAFQRRIMSIQAELEKIIESQIFKRVLQANGFDVHVEFEWGTPSVLEIEGRVTVLTELIKSPTTSGAMRMMLEDELILLLKLDEDEWEKLKEEQKKEDEERERLEARPQPIVPGQNKAFPQPAVPKVAQPKQPKPEEIFKEIEDIFDKKLNKRTGQEIERYQLLVDQLKNIVQQRAINTNNEQMDPEDLVTIFKKMIESKNTKEVDNLNKEFNKIIDNIKASRSEEISQIQTKYDDEQISQKKEVLELKNAIDKQKNSIKELEAKQKINNDKTIKAIKDNEVKKLITQMTHDINELKEEKEKAEEKLFNIQAEREENERRLIAMQKEREEDKKRYDEMLAMELSRTKKQKTSPKKIKKSLKTRGGLLRPFRITRKTESVRTEEPKAILKVKRSKKDNNYEYEKICPHCTEKVSEMNDIEEWIGFSYKKYLAEILKVLGIYEFANIKAVNEIELQAGMLTSTQVAELKKVLDNGFRKGLGMKEMAIQVDKKVALKDLYRMTSAGDIKTGVSGLPILARSADKRAIAIVRSEVTRMANEGAVEFYKKNDISQVSWVSSFSDRTCPECEALNGQIFEINKHPDIPFHPMCRCTLTPVVELK